ncbi:RNA polymerase sigma factor [Kitasatospora sp. NPDC054939]
MATTAGRAGRDDVDAASPRSGPRESTAATDRPHTDGPTKAELGEIYSRIQPLVRSSGLGVQERQDVTQETVLAVFAHWRELDCPLAYAFTTARRAMHRLYRDRNRQIPVGGFFERPGMWSERYAELDLPLERSQLLAEALKVCDEYLTPAQRTVFQLVFVYGMGRAEAAEAMGVQPATVNSHIRDAQARFRPHLGELDRRLRPH